MPMTIMAWLVGPERNNPATTQPTPTTKPRAREVPVANDAARFCSASSTSENRMFSGEVARARAAPMMSANTVNATEKPPKDSASTALATMNDSTALVRLDTI